MKITTKKLVYTALFIAIALILPQIFHFSFGAVAGKTFLPMHIPVIICAMLTGPVCGAVAGLVSPLLSFLISAMPAATSLPFMMAELCIYGILAGFSARKFGGYISLLITVFGGRIANIIFLYIAAATFAPNVSPAATVYTAFITGIFGVIIQFIIIPPIVAIIKKSGVLK